MFASYVIYILVLPRDIDMNKALDMHQGTVSHGKTEFCLAYSNCQI